MERLVTVKQMRERYGCSNPTARKYLRQCQPHMEKPLTAPEWAVQRWEESRMVTNGKIRGLEVKTSGIAYVPRTR